MAGAILFGVSLLHSTLRALPLKATSSPALGRGLWLLGGAVVVARLTGGAMAHIAGMLRGNASRKRRLQEKLQVLEVRLRRLGRPSCRLHSVHCWVCARVCRGQPQVVHTPLADSSHQPHPAPHINPTHPSLQERIHIMASLAQWVEKQEGPSAEQPGAEAELAAMAQAEAEAGEEEGGWRRVSPTGSAGSAESAEMVEAPRAEELAAAGARQAGPSGTAAAAPGAEGSGAGSSAAGRGQRRGDGGGSGGLAAMLAYAELGRQ